LKKIILNWKLSLSPPEETWTTGMSVFPTALSAGISARQIVGGPADFCSNVPSSNGCRLEEDYLKALMLSQSLKEALNKHVLPVLLI
jgi:hypothetical protein